MNKFLKVGLLIPCMIAISVLSCKKDKTEETVPTPDDSGAAIVAGTKSCLLIKLTYDGGDYETYEYDSKNRPVKNNSFSNGVPDGYKKITYNGNDISQEYYDNNNVKEDVYTFKLGSNGYISSAANSNSYTNGGYNYTETENYTITYNAEGYLTKVVNTEVSTSDKPGYVSQTSTSTQNYTYSNGNLISFENTSGLSTLTTRYEYYTDKPNNLPRGEGDEVLDFLLGKRSTNLLKKETETPGTSTTNTPSYIGNYTYSFNADGLVSKKTTSNDSYTDNQTFEYGCR